jgi:CheY-like chemotaxis protein
MSNKGSDFLYVLLADDDADDRMFFEEAITEINLQVDARFVKDGQELMNYLLGSGIILPQILFLDLNMPFKNGFQCLEEIRTMKAFQDIFIIIYSTTARPSDIDTGFNKGANLFIQKPNSFSELKNVLRHIFTSEHLDFFPPREKFVFQLSK